MTTVNVLEVLDDVWKRGLVGENVLAYEEARAAVAELIELVKWIDEIGGCGATVHRRVENALSRIGGGA